MIILIIILVYIANVYLNRYIYFKIVKIDEDFYPDRPAFIMIFLSLFGTIVLGIVYLNESKIFNKVNCNWFKPKFLKDEK